MHAQAQIQLLSLIKNGQKQELTLLINVPQISPSYTHNTTVNPNVTAMDTVAVGMLDIQGNNINPRDQ